MSKTPRGRRPLSRARLERGRGEILAAARALFLRHGYGSVSMRALARATGMSATSLYRYYPNKRAILVHIWAGIFTGLFETCRAAAAGAPNPGAAVAEYAHGFVGYWLANPENYMMVYGEIDSPQKGESFFADNELVADEMAYLRGLLVGAGIGEVRADLALQQLLCILHGVCHSLITIPELNWMDHRLITGGLVDGLLNRPATRNGRPGGLPPW